MGFLTSRQHMGLAAIILAASAFVSRLMGLARDKIISWQFGANGEADMYFAAFVVPDIINYLLAGGFMSITIIPLLARGFAEDEPDAWNFFSCVLLWMFLASCALTGIGEIFAEYLALMAAPGFSPEQCHRLAFFMRIILPAQIFFLTGAPFTALLLLRRQFAVPAITPLIYNGAIILLGVTLPLLPGARENFGMTGYCIGVSIGAAAGAFILPFIAAFRGRLNLHIVLHHPWLKKFLIIALPLMLGQTVVMLDEQFLRVFGSMLGEGNVSLLNYGRRIAQVPVALMGQAIAMASYPFLVNLLAKNDIRQFDSTLNDALEAGLILIIPCALFMTVAAQPILTIIFQGGRFGPAETAACVPLTRLLLLATPFWIFYMVIVRGFYAHGDTLTPAITGTIITLVCIPAYYLFAAPLGAWAICAISGISIAAYALWLAFIWIRGHGSGAFAGIFPLALRSLTCALPASALCFWTQSLWSGSLASCPPFLGAILSLAGTLCVFTPAFLILATFIAPAQLKKIRQSIGHRFNRRAG